MRVAGRVDVAVFGGSLRLPVRRPQKSSQETILFGRDRDRDGASLHQVSEKENQWTDKKMLTEGKDVTKTRFAA